jgi:branched-chain amino acid transport system substrate-binding protein
LRTIATCCAALALTLAATAALAGSDAVRIGVLTDMSGPYSDNLGPGAVLAARMAVDEVGGKVAGKRIELLVADHQNKPDVGVSIIRKWFDVDHIDAITEMGNSAVALAARDIVEQRRKPALVVGAASTDLTGKSCSRYLSQWNLDTYASANGITRALVGNGLDTWFFVTVDYSYGTSLQAAAARTIESLGGKVLGEARHPLGAHDFAPYLLQAQSSRAKVIGFVSAGTDLIEALKQANEFGLAGGSLAGGSQKLVPFLLFPTHIRALGLEVTKGLVFADSFYADHNAETRKFAAAFMAKFDNKVPTSNQVAEYLAVRNYLRAVAAAGSDDAEQVTEQLRGMDIDNFGEAVRIRADGRVMRDLYLLQVKSPQQATGPTDYYQYLKTIPAEAAYLPAAQSDCPLMKR